MKSFLSKYFLSAASILCTASFIHAQTQLGSSINGETNYDNSGFTVSMPDANTLAIGAPYNSGTASSAGHARVFTWNGNEWEQKGSDIDAEAQQDFFGWSVSMPDANTIGIGAPHNQEVGTTSGHVRIFEWSGSEWTQKGIDIDAEAQYDEFGYSVSMPDANTVAIGGPYNFGGGIFAGHARIYSWDGVAWVQKGMDLDAEASSDGFGWAVSMPDANTVAIGAPSNDGGGSSAGHVRVFDWNDSNWVQRGVDLDGEASGDNFGKAISMVDANTLAIGAALNDGGAEDAGQVRVFEWSGTEWVQKGADIDGEFAGDFFGTAVSMVDVNTVAISAPENDENGNNTGKVSVFSWNGSAWVEQASSISGFFQLDRSGRSISMPDVSTLAIGTPDNDGGGTNRGQVKVYGNLISSIIESSLPKITAFPNPTSDVLNLDLGETISDLNVKVINITGQEILTQNYQSTDRLSIQFDGPAGLYFVSVSSGNSLLASVKVQKK